MFRRLLPALVASVLFHAGLVWIVLANSTTGLTNELVDVEILGHGGGVDGPESAIAVNQGSMGTPLAAAHRDPIASDAAAGSSRSGTAPPPKDTAEVDRSKAEEARGPKDAGLAVREASVEPAETSAAEHPRLPDATSSSDEETVERDSPDENFARGDEGADPDEPTHASEALGSKTTGAGDSTAAFTTVMGASGGSGGGGAGRGGKAAAGGGGPGAGAGQASLRDHLRRHAKRCYPRAAERRMLEGISTVSFCVDAAGKPERIRLVKGSGSSLLDQAAIDCVLVGGAPLPAPPSCHTIPIRFTLR